jgi:biopolymer transport protein ExbB/TolQ
VNRANWISQLLLRSPLVWGTLATVAFYTLLDSGKLSFLGEAANETLVRYFAGHWVEYIEGGLFFFGMAALAIKALDLLAQHGSLRLSPLGDEPQRLQTADDCPSLLAQLESLPSRVQESYLVQRLRAALQHIAWLGGAEKLDEELKYLSEADAARAQESYGLVKIIVWAIPILGFLGTVIGITLAIANISPQQLEESLPEVTAGLGVAFDTTAIALTQSMFLMFGWFFCSTSETKLLSRVDAKVQTLLAGRFEAAGAAADPHVAAVRRMADTVVQTTEKMVERQVQLWQSTIGEAHQRWTQSADATRETLETGLSKALSHSLQEHARQLAAAADAATERNLQHWQGVQQALLRTTEALTAQQRELVRQGDVLRQVVEATGQVARLEDTLNRNLAALSGAQNFEETVQSLAAVIHLLNARLGQTAPVAARTVRSSGQAA